MWASKDSALADPDILNLSLEGRLERVYKPQSRRPTARLRATIRSASSRYSWNLQVASDPTARSVHALSLQLIV